MKKPLLCKIGIHTSKFLESAHFTKALKCNRCLAWINKEAGALVDLERDMWSRGFHARSIAIAILMRRTLDD